MKPHLANIFPSSVNDKKGDVAGEIPPILSCSARFMQILSSYSVSPPREAEIKTPSGINVFK